MQKKIEEAKKSLESEVKAITSLKEAELLKTKYLGRKGVVSDFMKLLPMIPVEQRATFGQRLNALKNEITDILEKRIASPPSETTPKGKQELFDITLPGTQPF
ncbi:MAG: phenylalanine--tRNA ligase subunit alpha, partial [Planctomycetes bacterium]|nr:phenylalanine--tRNA ligase subunit alpha [Planctomycetota bacterium]